jgi:exodeoxyribonuclease V alpha subunit
LILCIARDSEPRDIRGIGFKTADAIAMELGIDKTAMIRARAGISYALSEAMDEGHCGLPASELVSLAEKLLEVPEDLISSALGLELADGTVMADWVGETLVPAYAATKGILRVRSAASRAGCLKINGVLSFPIVSVRSATPAVTA